MKPSRDELLVIPEQDLGGFICPICKSVAIGKSWQSHCNYCPDCGQRIKIDTPLFKKLRDKTMEIPEAERMDLCAQNVFIGLSGQLEKDIAGVYKKRLEARAKDPEQPKGQIRMSDYLKDLAERGMNGKDHSDA